MTIPVTEVVENLAARSLHGLWLLSLLQGVRRAGAGAMLEPPGLAGVGQDGR